MTGAGTGTGGHGSGRGQGQGQEQVQGQGQGGKAVGGVDIKQMSGVGGWGCGVLPNIHRKADHIHLKIQSDLEYTLQKNVCIVHLYAWVDEAD